MTNSHVTHSQVLSTWSERFWLYLRPWIVELCILKQSMHVGLYNHKRDENHDETRIYNFFKLTHSLQDIPLAVENMFENIHSIQI